MCYAQGRCKAPETDTQGCVIFLPLCRMCFCVATMLPCAHVGTTVCITAGGDNDRWTLAWCPVPHPRSSKCCCVMGPRTLIPSSRKILDVWDPLLTINLIHENLILIIQIWNLPFTFYFWKLLVHVTGIKININKFKLFCIFATWCYVLASVYFFVIPLQLNFLSATQIHYSSTWVVGGSFWFLDLVSNVTVMSLTCLDMSFLTRVPLQHPSVTCCRTLFCFKKFSWRHTKVANDMSRHAMYVRRT